jgi:hypothetical protein
LSLINEHELSRVPCIYKDKIKYFDLYNFIENNNISSSNETTTALKLHSQCISNGSVVGTCDQGLICYSQNTWYAQCLVSCPVGWACQDPTIDPSNLTLWQQSGEQLFFEKINSVSWQKIISNLVVANLTVISDINDTVVLYDSFNLTYYALNSHSIYNGSSLTKLNDSSTKNNGTWLLVYYSGGIGTNNLWTFKNIHYKSNFHIPTTSCFVSIESLIPNTWIR